ncbi:MAG: peptidylprolyl isomerase [Acidobacteriota bacterium]|jgi:peptidyl-prolyl cis-trans isomerase C|nr:peptidylprolyl isomerase [Acidobacteriota bacterium]
MIRFAAVVTILLSLLTPGAMPAAVAQEPAPDPAQAPASGAMPETDLVVARVSGVPITEKQVLDVIAEIARQQGDLPLDRLQQRNALFFNDAIDNLVTLTLLREHAKEQAVVVTDAEVAAQVKQMAGRFASQEEFQKALAAQGMTEADLGRNIRGTISLQKVIDGATKDAPPVTDADVERFYAANPDKFALPERVHAAHILLQIPQGATPAQKAELQKELERIRFDIEAEAVTFADAAAKHSQDKATAAKGGDMGLLSRPNLPKPFADALFNAKPGTLSPVLESQAGYHIVKALEVKPAGTATLEESKPAIRQLLEQEAKQTARRRFVAALKDKAKVEAFMDAEEFAKRHP